ncbi:potassium voltage-gated channel subfamily B member 2-like [Lepeophtheirus salmonis]|uniref:potassium voltage-gated channel subfamily B member 2-like n=1 Tax=Lepeophtheirus salmonis TaxID=72036 RepID=UPI003AF3C313
MRDDHECKEKGPYSYLLDSKDDDEPPYIQSKTGNIIIDVGGQIHNTRIENLKNFLPASRLGKLVRAKSLIDVLKLCDAYVEEESNNSPIVFYDRNGQGFNTILDIYRFQILHFTEKSCAIILKSDFDYWGIDEILLEPCCALKYYPEMEICEETFGDTRLAKVRKQLWNLIEYPESGKDAQIMAFFSLIVVIVSTGTFILGTLEEFRELEHGEVIREGETYYPNVVFAISIFDTLCVAFFTIEYSIRFICCPVKLRFVLEPMNLVDLFAILPFYLSLFLRSLEDIKIIGKAGKIIRLVRVMRILRVFKLVRHFAGLQSLIHTMKQAYKELGLLLLLIGVAVLTVACLIYFTEREGSGWTFVDSFWFSLMTLTTVGYDLNPFTLGGKITGGFCALMGIFILTLPIPIVVNSFASYYKNRLWRNEVAAKKRERIRETGNVGVLSLMEGIETSDSYSELYGIEMKELS